MKIEDTPKTLFPDWNLNIDTDEHTMIVDYFNRKKLVYKEQTMIKCLETQKNKQELFWAIIALRELGTEKSILPLKKIVPYKNLDVQGNAVMTIAKLANGTENEFFGSLLLSKDFKAKWYAMFALNYKADKKAVPFVLEYALKSIKSVKNKGESAGLIIEYLCRFAPKNEQAQKIFAKINKNFTDLSPTEQMFFMNEFPHIFRK